ncbi:MAG TPA: hypothetical protein VNN80_15565 [Polyangiaceae bacterium]|nr:hypothetical protein [Polyangiaceae bacterium]
MSHADLSSRDSSLWAQDALGMLGELSKQIPLPEGGVLRGEVVRAFEGGARLHLREGGQATVEVQIEEPLWAERGDLVEVRGVPELIAGDAPVGLRMIWRGSTGENRGPSQRFRARRTYAEERAAKLPFETPRINARLRSGGRLWVVTSQHSRARKEIEEAARQYRWLKLDPRFCEDLEPGSIAAALESLLEVVHPSDVVLLTRDAGQVPELDAFEDKRVVAALASLTQRCSTILAVGYVGDDFVTGKVATYPSEGATAALQLIVRESRGRANERANELHAPEAGDEEGAGEVADATDPAVSPGARRADAAPPGARLVRLLLLGAAAYVGWWARGAFSEGGAQPQQAAVEPSSTGAQGVAQPSSH